MDSLRVMSHYCSNNFFYTLTVVKSTYIFDAIEKKMEAMQSTREETS